MPDDTARPTNKLDRGLLATLAALSFAIVSFIYFQKLSSAGSYFLEDDAYYYIVIARNFVKYHFSTFDGQTLTNGYHPLWQFLLIGFEYLFGLTRLSIGIVEFILCFSGTFLIASVFQSRSILLSIAFGGLLAVLSRGMIGRGMEVSLIIFAWGIFVWLLARAQRQPDDLRAKILLGLAGVLCIGARLEMALFVIPILLYRLRFGRANITPLLIIGAVLAIYAAANFYFFGVPMPVSGAVKSLGGIQINVALWRSIFGGSDGQMSVLALIQAFAGSLIGRMLVVFALCVVLLFFTARESFPRLLFLGYAVGLGIFLAKIAFGSSWIIWSWYAFPNIIGTSVAFICIDQLLQTYGARRPVQLFAAVSGLACLGYVAAATASTKGYSNLIFEPVNEQAAKTWAPLFNGARVAMGDRAGSFAYYYAGPVTQLEGLVNDVTYLQALKGEKDLHQLLCDRGVKFVVSYQQDLGNYSKVDIPVIRPTLAGFAAPRLSFSKADEIGRVEDVSKFNTSATPDKGDHHLYAWRMSGC